MTVLKFEHLVRQVDKVETMGASTVSIIGREGKPEVEDTKQRMSGGNDDVGRSSKNTARYSRKGKAW